MRRLLALPLILVLVALPITAVAAPQGDEIDGGPAPTQATAVEAGTAYADDISPGEARWFSLDAETGQRLGATLTEYGDTEYNCCLKIELSNPDFDAIEADNSYNNNGTAQTLRAETDDDGVDDPGTYYFSVELEQSAAKRPVAFDFSIDVDGEGMLTSEPSPTSEPTPSPSTTAGSTATEDRAASSASTQDTDGTSTLLWVVVGVLALMLVVLLGLVVALLRRLSR